MSRSRNAALIAAAFLALPLAGPSFARSTHPGAWRGADEGQDPPEGFQPRLSAQAGVLCVKQCPNDQLPCDPPSYKVADGRCATQWR